MRSPWYVFLPAARPLRGVVRLLQIKEGGGHSPAILRVELEKGSAAPMRWSIYQRNRSVLGYWVGARRLFHLCVFRPAPRMV